jgi:hypothetical protein
MNATLGQEMWLVEEIVHAEDCALCVNARHGCSCGARPAWVLCVPFARFSDGSGAPGIVDGTVRVLKEGTRVEVEG